jgi:hypothetical protein
MRGLRLSGCHVLKLPRKRLYLLTQFLYYGINFILFVAAFRQC